MSPAGAAAATRAQDSPAAAKRTGDRPATAKRKAPRPRAARRSAPSSSPGLETIVQDDGLLLYRPKAEVEAAVAKMRELGVDRVRITASWSALTRAPESGERPADFDARDPAAYEQPRWRGLDAAIRAIRGAGLKALVDIGFWAPHWATTDQPGPRARTNIDPQAYAEFATAVALRYSGSFTPPSDDPAQPPPPPNEDDGAIQELLQPIVPFPVPDPIPPWRAAQDPGSGGASAPDEPLPQVDRFIIWNEPNHQGLLMPQWDARRRPASPAVYRAMLRAGYAAVKAARPGASVLVGNTSSTGGARGRGPVGPLWFLRELACVSHSFKPRTTGDCANFKTLPGDGWAHHPYSQNERPTRESRRRSVRERYDVRLADLPVLAGTLDRLVRMGRLARGNRRIYLTEFGYETKDVRGRPRVSEDRQAHWLTWAEYLADRVPAVRSFAQFLLRDQPPAPHRVTQSSARPYGEYSTGLLNVDGSDKPAARTFVAGLFAQLRPKGTVLLYGRLRLGAGPKVVVVQRRVRGGRWTRVARIRMDGTASFTRTIRHRGGALYRLTYPSPAGPRAAGPSVRPVGIAG